jgi:ATP-dependent Clp protease ATP-binding subunit ClpC
VVFERFTDRARRVMVLAQDEARRLNHNYIGTEHLLLGMISEGEGIAPRALESLDISLEAVRLQVEEITPPGKAAPEGHVPFTPRAKKVLELSLREALQLGHNYIGTEHMLLGLIREGDGVAAQVLKRLGADSQRVRHEVILLLSGSPVATAGEAEGRATRSILRTPHRAEQEPPPTMWPLCPRCRSPLEETARYRVLDVRSDEEEDARAVPFAFCSKCGVWLGTIG